MLIIALKPKKIERLQKLLDGKVKNPTDEDLELLRKAERKFFKLIEDLQLVRGDKMVFEKHVTIQ